MVNKSEFTKQKRHLTIFKMEFIFLCKGFQNENSKDKFSKRKEGEIMYPNLKAEIARRNLTNAAVASAIGLSESQFSQKMNGIYPFSLKQAIEIKNFLNTTLTIEELFSKEGEE